MRERGFALEPMRIVAGRDQQDGGSVGPDAVHVEKGRRGAADECMDQSVEVECVGFEIKDPSTEGADREFRRVHHRTRARRGP
jgi:hypothetical protein